jgi:hypothetical protein
MIRVPARELRRGDVTLGSRLRVLAVAPLPGAGGKVCLTLERMSGPNAGTSRTAEWGRSTIIGIHRPEDCPHCGGSGIKPGTVGAGCGHCEHGNTPPPFKVGP